MADVAHRSSLLTLAGTFLWAASPAPSLAADTGPQADATADGAVSPSVSVRPNSVEQGSADPRDGELRPVPVPAPARMQPAMPPPSTANPAAESPVKPPVDRLVRPALTWYGVTLYGVVDVGLAHLSHGAPPSNTYGPGLPYIVQSYSNRSMTSVAGNGLSQSKVGLSGVEPLGVLDLRAVFKLESGFQPTSGRLTDGPRSLVDNNGRAAADKVTGGDSARAGQAFQGAAYAGLGSASVGVLTFGRQGSLMADDLSKYDPQMQSQAFSPIGYSGTAGGLGATEAKILDDALKCVLAYGPFHLAGLYQFASRGALPGGSESLGLGVDYLGFSADVLWGRVHGAVVAASLNAAQAAEAPGTLAATVSDNTAYAIMARYVGWRLKVYAGYEHMTFANPKDPLPNGTVTLGGYVLSNVNNSAYTLHKVLQYAWAGLRVSVAQPFEVSVGYYYFRQNSYNASPCSDDSATSCSGSYHVASLVADYKLSLRLDAYAGVGYSRAMDGMVSGFLNDRNWTSMTGLRFTF